MQAFYNSHLTSDSSQEVGVIHLQPIVSEIHQIFPITQPLCSVTVILYLLYFKVEMHLNNGTVVPYNMHLWSRLDRLQCVL